MISTLYLQAEIGAAIVAAFFVAIIISIIFYVIQFKHNNVEDLEKRLYKFRNKYDKCLILTVFKKLK